LSSLNIEVIGKFYPNSPEAPFKGNTPFGSYEKNNSSPVLKEVFLIKA
tara:strand:+ start:592 stop:735 length:144 start_codon:yes stop_codon:yes gene_type:complete